MYNSQGESLGGHYDSKLLGRASKVTIDARRQGLTGRLKVKCGYGGFDAVVIDENGERWVPQGDGTLMSVAQLDALEEFDGDLEECEKFWGSDD